MGSIMAMRRIFSGPGAFYHCMSRTVNGERVFNDPEKEVLRRQLHQVAEFCGIEVVTYAIMSNHFHVLVRVPEPGPVSDAELMRRYRILYPRPRRHSTALVSVLEELLKAGGPAAEQIRQKLTRLMGDLSVFMKILKQRFSTWFNKSRKRYGPVWAERFTSVVVQGDLFAVKTVATYIDLNPVRAGITDDPAQYRFCGYGEAQAAGRCGQLFLRHAILSPEGRSDADILAIYRMGLFTVGAGPKRGASKAGRIDLAKTERVTRSGGRLALAERLLLRVAWMTHGGVIGSQLFVREHLEKYRELTGRRKNHPPQTPLPDAEWGALHLLRRAGG